MQLLILRPFYGVTVHSDMAGDYGIAEYIPHCFPDLSMVYGAALAKANGIEVDVLDENATKSIPSETLKKIEKNYDYIIIKVAAPTITLDIEFARLLKRRYSGQKIVLAGHTAAVLKNWILSNVPEVDEAAEESLEDYIFFLVCGERKHIHLDQLPLPDYTLLPYKNYWSYENRFRATIYSSRGCVFKCSYCPYTAFYGNKIEERSMTNFNNDIKHLLDLGFRNIHFRDQYFTYDADRVREICNSIISNQYRFKWVCETTVNSLSIDLIDKMVEAGLEIICFGIESASRNILDQYHRFSINIDKGKEIIQYLNKKGVTTIGFYIIGFPDDTWETISDTLDLALELKTSNALFNVWKPYPDTLSWKELNTPCEITPRLFKPFDNILNINPVSHMNKNQIDFSRWHLKFKYYEAIYGIDYAYQNLYKEVRNEQISRRRYGKLYQKMHKQILSL
jgi:radical SAM superfamily enzyme YgiQ (UPF0313 family)